MGYLIMLIYPIGFLLTLTFFKYFGVKIGLDYDEWSKNEWYDDYESNAEAYLVFSVAWPITMTLLIVIGTWALLRVLVDLYLDKTKFP
jgi:uncharacterized paraquat-inducible protein A